MKLPRGISGSRVMQSLVGRLDYRIVHRRGSQVVLQSDQPWLPPSQTGLKGFLVEKQLPVAFKGAAARDSDSAMENADRCGQAALSRHSMITRPAFEFDTHHRPGGLLLGTPRGNSQLGQRLLSFSIVLLSQPT